MPPIPKRDCGLVLFDVSSPKKSELLNGLIKFSVLKWFLNSKSIYRLILVNTAKTSNDKNYPNIYTTDIEDFDPKLVVEAIEGASEGEADWLDAILLAIHHLEEAVEMRGLVTLQLIFFTTLDAVNSSALDQNKVKKIISKLNEHDMYLYIIGPDLEMPFTITNRSCISKCMIELNTDTENDNLVAAKKLVTGALNGVMCNTKIGVNLLISFKNSPGSQSWKVPFTFGTKLSIPAATVKVFRKDMVLRLCSSIQKNYVKTLADQREVQVDDEDIVKGILRHGKFIKIEDEMFKSNTERCFEIIGFTEKKFVFETYLMGEDTFYVLPDESTDDGFQIFVHLVKILAETNKYAICKRVYSKNNRARFFVLIPNVDHVPKCFTMTGLSFADFLSPHKCVVATSPKEPIKHDDFYRYFQSMIVPNTVSNGNALGPTMMLDFHQHKIVNAVAKKYLNKDDLEIDNLNINDHDNPPNNNFLDIFRQSWPETPTEN